MRYADSVPKQLCRSMMACSRVCPCALWAVIANAGMMGTCVRLIVHDFRECGCMNRMSTVSCRAATCWGARWGRFRQVVVGASISHEIACRCPCSSVRNRIFVKVPVHPLTIPPSTSKFWHIMTGIPITNGSFPSRWFVFPECRLARWCFRPWSSMILPEWESVAWYQCKFLLFLLAKSNVALMFKASFTSLLDTIIGVSLQCLSLSLIWSEHNCREFSIWKSLSVHWPRFNRSSKATNVLLSSPDCRMGWVNMTTVFTDNHNSLPRTFCCPLLLLMPWVWMWLNGQLPAAHLKIWNFQIAFRLVSAEMPMTGAHGFRAFR